MNLFQAMRRLGHLAGASRRRQRLTVEAALALIRLGATIRVLPYRRWKHLVELSRHDQPNPLSRDEIDDVLWAVDRVGRALPARLTCLPRALATRELLRRRGCETTLCIGVARGLDAEAPGNAELAAHAWIELDGEVLIGHLPRLDEFARLERWPARGTSRQ